MFFTLLFFGLCLAQESEPTPPPKSKAPQKIEGIAAIVNNEVITESELQTRLESAKQSFGYQDPLEWQRFRRETLTRIVLDKLLAQAAKRTPLDQQEIEAEVKEFLKESEKNAGGKANLIEKLQQIGRTYEDFVADARNDVLANRLRGFELGLVPGASGRPGTEIFVTPGEMRQYYQSHMKSFLEKEAVRGRQIFVSTDAPSDFVKARTTIEDLQNRIKGGEDFETLAKKYSDWKAQEGGSFGWIEKGTSSFDKKILSFLYNNPAGSVSDVIALNSGFALVKVEETRKERQKTFEDVQAQIMIKIINDRRQSRLEALQRRLLKDYYVWPDDLIPR